MEFCALHIASPTRIPSQLENSANGDWRFLLFCTCVLSFFLCVFVFVVMGMKWHGLHWWSWWDAGEDNRNGGPGDMALTAGG